MTTTTTPTAADVPAPKERKRRNFSTVLRGPDGSETLRVHLKLHKDGTAITYTVHTVREGKKKRHEKGATKQHPGLEPAKAKAEQLVASAVKLGWTIPERKRGFQPKPDAYDENSLPAPGGAAKPAGKTAPVKGKK